MASSSRTVTVNIVGDASGLNRSLKSAGDTAGTTGSRIGGAFRGAFSVIANSTGGAFGPLQEIVGNLGPAFDSLSDKSASFSEKMIGVGAGMAGAGVALEAFGSSDQAAERGLAQAISNVGGSYADYKDRIEDAVKANEHFGYTSNQTQNALQALTTATRSPTQALGLMGTAADLAATKHEDLSAATQQLIQIIAGKGTKTLASLGIQHVAVANTAKMLTSATAGVTKAQTTLANAQQHLSDLETIDHAKKKLTIGDEIALRNAQEKVTTASGALVLAHGKVRTAENAAAAAGKAQGKVLAQVAAITKGQAEAQANTFTGRLKALRAEVEDSAATLGQKYGPALTAVGSGLAIVGSLATAGSQIVGHFSQASRDAAQALKDQQAATDAATAAQEALASKEALAAVGADADVAADGLETVALGTEDVGLGLTAILEGLTLGPIILIVAALAALGLAAYELVTHWSAVWGAIKAVVVDAWHGIDDYFVQPVEDFFSAVPAFIQSHWQLILAILTGPIGLAVLFIKDNFQQVLDFFTDIPGEMASIGEHMWDWVTAGLRSVVDDVASLWNDTVGSLSFKIPSWVPFGLGGDGFSMPKIPMMAAGGVVTRSTFAMLGERGPEAVIPLPAAGIGGLGGGHDHVLVVNLDGRAVGSGVATHVRTHLLQTSARNATRVGLA